MLDEQRVRGSVRRLRVLIRIGRERLAGDSPARALFLAGEKFRATSEALNEPERGAVGSTAGPDARP